MRTETVTKKMILLQIVTRPAINDAAKDQRMRSIIENELLFCFIKVHVSYQVPKTWGDVNTYTLKAAFNISFWLFKSYINNNSVYIMKINSSGKVMLVYRPHL